MKRRRKKIMARKFKKKRIKFPVSIHTKMLLQIQSCDTISIFYILEKKGQHALECVQKGIATSYEQIKANPAQRLQRRRERTNNT
jgi:hypothetical protein